MRALGSNSAIRFLVIVAVIAVALLPLFVGAAPSAPHTAGLAAVPIGQGWVCDGQPTLRYKGSTGTANAGSVAGGAYVPYIVLGNLDRDGFHLTFQDKGEIDFPLARFSGFQRVAGSNQSFNPISLTLFAHDNDGDGLGDQLKGYARHFRGSQDRNPDADDPVRDDYVVDFGCRFTGVYP